MSVLGYYNVLVIGSILMLHPFNKKVKKIIKKQAKVAELERTNKKLYDQTHADRKEIICLKEEMQSYKNKTSKLERQNSLIQSHSGKIEDAHSAKRKMTELRQQNSHPNTGLSTISPQVNPKVLELKKHTRVQQEQLDRKTEAMYRLVTYHELLI